MNETRKIALCGMMAAFSIVVLLLGAAIGLGMYAAPMFAGLFLLPIGHEVGRKYQWILWLCISLLSFILISEIEQNLMYASLFGLYPIVRPAFERLNKSLRVLSKLLFLNIMSIAVEMLVVLVFVPETVTAVFVITMLVLANITFFIYDRLLPLADVLLSKRVHALFKRFGR